MMWFRFRIRAPFVFTVLGFLGLLIMGDAFLEPSQAEMRRGASAPSKIRLPYDNERGSEGEELNFSLIVTALTPFTRLQIVPDDCITALKINGTAVDLKAFDSAVLCNWQQGVFLKASENFHIGSNSLEVTVKNQGGPMGVTILKSLTKVQWVLLVGYFFLLGYLGLRERFGRWIQFLETRRWVAPALIVLCSYSTVVHRYWHPDGYFWDEHYHVAAAEKYLQKSFFMEPHPPLGKLFIAAGEALLKRNPRVPQAVKADTYYPPTPPDMLGFRLFPVLFAWLSCLLLYELARRVSGSRAMGLAIGLLLAFDNVFLLQTRSAMLDSTLIFFCLLTVWLAALLMERRKVWMAALTGLAFGCGITTKVLALIVLPALIVMIAIACKRVVLLRRRLLLASSVIAATAFTYFAVWQIHFSLSQEITNGTYNAGEASKKDIMAGTYAQLHNFGRNLAESHVFSESYHTGVPELDLCKQGENGSPWFFWLFGGRTINYRWEKVSPAVFRYLYLVPNPVTWALALLGVGLVLSQFIHLMFFPSTTSVVNLIKRNPATIGAFFTYLAYLAGVSLSSSIRVMYLYHYLLALIFGLLTLAGVAKLVRDPFKGSRFFSLRGIFAGIVGLSCVAYLVLSPLTYFFPTSSESFAKIPRLSIWDLRCLECESKNHMFKAPPVKKGVND